MPFSLHVALMNPIGTNIAVLQRQMIRPRRAPSRVAASARIETAPLHHEFGDACDGVGNPPRLVRGQVTVPTCPLLQVIPAIDRGQLDAVGVLDDKALLGLPFERPAEIGVSDRLTPLEQNKNIEAGRSRMGPAEAIYFAREAVPRCRCRFRQCSVRQTVLMPFACRLAFSATIRRCRTSFTLLA
jgi:hypothetical protein